MLNIREYTTAMPDNFEGKLASLSKKNRLLDLKKRQNIEN